MIEYEKVKEEYNKFTTLLKQYCKEGWWNVDFVLENLLHEQIMTRLEEDGK